MSVFDGLAGVVRGVLGGDVTIAPADGPHITARAVFRETPEYFDGAEGGRAMAIQPELVCAPEIAELVKKGARVLPPNGKTYVYYAPARDNANPASDHNVRVLLVLAS